MKINVMRNLTLLLAVMSFSVGTVGVNGSSFICPIPNRVVAWGENTSGETQPPAVVTNVLMISAAPARAAAILADGTVFEWGFDNYGSIVTPAGLKAISVAAGRQSTAALRSNYTVVVWGDNTYGQTNVPAGLTNVVAISAGGNYYLALRADGRVSAWGDNTYGQTNVPAGLTNVVAISAGDNHAAALLSNGVIKMWGDNSSGQTAVPSGIGPLLSVSCGGGFTIALRADHRVLAWGNNLVGQTSVPGGSALNDVVEIWAGGSQAIAHTADGRIVTWGSKYWGACNTPVLPRALMVRSGGDFNIAVVDQNKPIIATLSLKMDVEIPVITVTGLTGYYSVEAASSPIGVTFASVGTVQIVNNIPVKFFDVENQVIQPTFYRTAFLGINLVK